jgi:hypothetical protein
MTEFLFALAGLLAAFVGVWMTYDRLPKRS